MSSSLWELFKALQALLLTLKTVLVIGALTQSAQADGHLSKWITYNVSPIWEGTNNRERPCHAWGLISNSFIIDKDW